MKGLLTLLVAFVLHPVAVVLAWLNISSRSDLGGGQKIVWGLVSLIWGVGPLLYTTVGGGTLW